MYKLAENVETRKSTTSQVSSMAVVSNDFNKLIFIERKLTELILKDRELANPVLFFLAPDFIKKMALHLSGLRNKRCTVGIAGETASGKTTITNAIIGMLEDYAERNDISNLITKINIDNYYYDRSEMVKAAGSFDKFVENYDLDVPEAFELELFNKHLALLSEGKEVMLPEYDMSGTAIRRDNHIPAKPSRIIITEGLFPLTEKTKDSFDIKIFVDIDEEIQKKRWYTRAKDRDLGESADRVYNNAISKAKVHIRPTKKEAQIVINGAADIEDVKNFIREILQIVRLANTQRELEFSGN